MAAHNALIVDASRFEAGAITDETRAFNAGLMKLMAQSPKWFQVGAKKHRQMRIDGETPLPKPRYLDSAVQLEIPSRDRGRMIPCRLFRPQNNQQAKAVYLHFHSGGWVLGDEKSQDLLLQGIADATGVLAFSVGYRLAPEYPFPHGPNDCFDAAEWLVDHAESELAASLGFCGGESAGAHLAVLTLLHLLHSPISRFANFRLKGLTLHFGCYSMVWTPSVYHFKKPSTLILDRELMDEYARVFLPGVSEAAKKDPSISPLYADFELLRGKLPPALFTCGTEDCLLDDTMFMGSKWMMAGAEAIVHIIPGAVHGYIAYPRDVKASCADEGFQITQSFLLSKLS